MTFFLSVIPREPGSGDRRIHDAMSEVFLQGDPLQATVGELMRLALEGDEQALVGLLSERIPGNMIRETPPPDLTSVL